MRMLVLVFVLVMLRIFMIVPSPVPMRSEVTQFEGFQGLLSQTWGVDPVGNVPPTGIVLRMTSMVSLLQTFRSSSTSAHFSPSHSCGPSGTLWAFSIPPLPHYDPREIQCGL